MALVDQLLHELSGVRTRRKVRDESMKLARRLSEQLRDRVVKRLDQ